MKKMLFDEGSKKFLLSAFDCKVDQEGFVTNKFEERIPTQDGREMTLENFGALKKGSLRFLEADLGSLLEVAEEV